MIPSGTSFRYANAQWRVVTSTAFLDGKVIERYYVVANRTASAILPAALVEAHAKGRS